MRQQRLVWMAHEPTRDDPWEPASIGVLGARLLEAAAHLHKPCPIACRFERWMQAALARPSAQQTKPSDEVIVEGLRKFVSPFKG